MKEIESREWKLRDTLPDAELSEKLALLAAETGLSRLALTACLARGLTDAESIQDFLSPRIDRLRDPMTLADMGRAVGRLSLARAEKQKIWVFGDYDVDGTTGAALLSWFFRENGFVFDARQPDRFKDGYGLNVSAVEEASQSGAAVLLTVDCGISSFAAAERAKELGLDLIVVDHHQLDPARGLPVAHAVVNPQRADCASGLKQLCGCGLAFYLLRALRTYGRDHGWWEAGAEPNLKRHLDLVVVATAADMVPLTGDNHILVRHGMEILKNTRKPGLKALLQEAGLGSKEVSPGHLGFVLGPRINASGRMGSASTALELLTTEDPARALELARQLEQVNRERADLQNRIWDEVRARVEAGIAAGKFKHGIVVADASWHEGVVGIVASRVTETFRRPAAVIALREDFGKGSVRSFAGKDVLEALRASSEHLLGFGGHRHAAGLSVAHERVEAFAGAFDSALAELEEDATARPLLIEGECSIAELDLRALEELERLGPFGPGNPEPVFKIRAGVRAHRVLKDRHLKLDLVSDEAIEAIWFHAAERRTMDELGHGESEWAGVPELNRFRGRVTPTFRVRDWRRSPSPSPCIDN